MLRPYLKIWDWDLILGRAVKAISSPGVRSPLHKVRRLRLSTIVVLSTTTKNSVPSLQVTAFNYLYYWIDIRYSQYFFNFQLILITYLIFQSFAKAFFFQMSSSYYKLLTRTLNSLYFSFPYSWQKFQFYISSHFLINQISVCFEYFLEWYVLFTSCITIPI